MNWPRFGRLTVVGIALLVVLTVTFGGAAAGHSGDDGGHHHDGPMGTHDGMGWGMGWGLWFLWPVLVLAAVGAVAYLLLTGAGGRTDGSGGSDDALTVLRERYARGEIDDDEFERRRRQLQDG